MGVDVFVEGVVERCESCLGPRLTGQVRGWKTARSGHPRRPGQ